MPSEDFNLWIYKTKFEEELRLVDIEDMKSDSYEDLERKFKFILKKVYTKKNVDGCTWTKKWNWKEFYIYKFLDNAWREHLYSMDTLKAGIGLRGYNQKTHLLSIKKSLIICLLN